MILNSVIATSLGIAIYRGAVSPLLTRYHNWKVSGRVSIARRNWRGVYVPDLGIKRVERTFWLALTCFVVLGIAVTWTALTMPR